MTEGERGGRRRRALVGVVAVAAVVLGGAWAAVAVDRARWRSRRQAVLDGLERDGLGTSEQDLGFDGAPDRAALDLVAAHRFVEALPEAAKVPLGCPLRDLLPGLASPEEALRRGVVARGGVDVDGDGQEDGPPPPPPDVVGLVRQVVAAVDRAQPAVDAALARGGGLRFAADWSRGLEADLPQLYVIKSLAAATLVRAGWRAHGGDVEGAWTDVARLAGLARALDEACLISRLVRLAVTRMAAGAAADLVALGLVPGAGARARIEAALGRLESVDGFGRALRGDLRLTLTSLDAGRDLADPAPLGLVARFRLWRHGERWLHDFAAGLAEAVRASAGGDLRARRAALVAVQDRIAAEGSPLASVLLPGFAHAFVKELDALAEVRLARAALRLGAAPLPAAAPDLPEDPWSGAPLRYARDDARAARVWSVGEDGRDDGGLPPPAPPPADEDAPPPPAPRPLDLIVQLRGPAP